MTKITWQDYPRKTELCCVANGSFFIRDHSLYIRISEDYDVGILCRHIASGDFKYISRSYLVSEVEIAEIIVRGYTG